MLFLNYESEDFPTTVLPNGQRRLSVTWDDVLWAAVRVGRPDLFHVFRHGEASVYEAIFRWSMVRMALQQRGPGGQKLVRTDAFKQMDSTEKGTVLSWFGGMQAVCMATLAAEALFDGASDKLINKVIEMAEKGDPTALKICIDRILPPRKDRPVSFKIPTIKAGQDVVAAIEAAVAAAAGAGRDRRHGKRAQRGLCLAFQRRSFDQ
jgi:hypothetical protein